MQLAHFRLVVVVCGERVMAVVCPLKARSFWSTKALKAICASILIFAVILSMHSHITHRVQDVLLNITVVDKDGVPRQQLRKTQQAVLREGMQQYWHLAVSLDIIFLVLLPVFLVITANMLLVSASFHSSSNYDFSFQALSTKCTTYLSH
ncbi:unnamed protein product [Anisakis simplex]|uniref:G_PROTEIN_RECEP_F1_2 domain-containing protein n=1 Tax=Anisakis simplex TaxID=6269 RepID=A0A0M3J5T0_ANISI|nr:unnamed protein product [Anisakis simplex]